MRISNALKVLAIGTSIFVLAGCAASTPEPTATPKPTPTVTQTQAEIEAEF